MPSEWQVYIVRCRDGTLYTGITTDLARRLEAHNSGKDGARYTRTRRPVKLVFSEPAGTRSTAARREWQIKRMTVAQKMRLLAQIAAPQIEKPTEPGVATSGAFLNAPLLLTAIIFLARYFFYNIVIVTIY